MSNNSTVIVIVGMHRSGTSLFSAILQDAGLDLGKNLLKPAADNKYGFFEDEDFLRFQDSILEKHGLDYLVQDTTGLNFDSYDLDIAKKLINKRKGQNMWGWKDPRTALFLEQWLHLMPYAQFFMIYRHPLEVVLSLLKRGGSKVLLRREELFNIWNTYNQKILEFYKKNEEKCVLINIHGLLENKVLFGDILKERYGISKSPDIDRIYDKDIFTRLDVPEWANKYLSTEYKESMNLYNELEFHSKIKYQPAPLSVDREQKFIKEIVETFSLVEKKLKKINKVFIPSYHESYDGNENIEKKYQLLELKYSELLNSSPMKLARMLKKYPRIEKASKKTIDIITSKLPLSKEIDFKLRADDIITYDLDVESKYKNNCPELNNVLHICHKNMHGVQSAVEYLPGKKVMLPMSYDIEKNELIKFLDYCHNIKIENIIVHSYWDNLDKLLFAMKKEFGTSINIYSVMHANTTQFVNQKVYASFLNLLKLREDHVINQIATVKVGLSVLSNNLFPKPIYNMPPAVQVAEKRIKRKENHEAFIPLRDIWRKNFYTNFFAASIHEKISTVKTTCRKIDTGYLDIKAKVEYLNNGKGITKDELFQVLDTVDIVLNVSLSECQPMILLESISAGVPCLIGSVNYGELDEHEYMRLVTIEKPDCIDKIKKKITNIINLRNNGNELDRLQEDFKSQIKILARDSYLNLLNA